VIRIESENHLDNNVERTTIRNLRLKAIGGDRYKRRVAKRRLKPGRLISIQDPDQWLDEEISRNILLTTMDLGDQLGPGRSGIVDTVCFPACCAFEFIATAAPALTFPVLEWK